MSCCNIPAWTEIFSSSANAVTQAALIHPEKGNAN